MPVRGVTVREAVTMRRAFFFSKQEGHSSISRDQPEISSVRNEQCHSPKRQTHSPLSQGFKVQAHVECM